METRQDIRKLLDPIHVSDIKTLNRLVPLAHYGTILNASSTGLLIEVSHGDLAHEIFRRDLPLDTIEGETVMMKIVEMDLEIDGQIVRVHHAEQERLEIAVDFAENAPAYWRQCLADLLPSLGEMEQAGASR